MNEPKPKGDLTDAPEWFSDDLRASWHYAVMHAPKGLLKRIDASVLTIWVVAENLHREAVMKVSQHGPVVSTSNGNAIQNPYLAIINKQAMIMMKAGSELGFSPATRPRIEIQPYEDESDDDEGDKEFWRR